jgi:hypothetical protein
MYSPDLAICLQRAPNLQSAQPGQQIVVKPEDARPLIARTWAKCTKTQPHVVPHAFFPVNFLMWPEISPPVSRPLVISPSRVSSKRLLTRPTTRVLSFFCLTREGLVCVFDGLQWTSWARLSHGRRCCDQRPSKVHQRYRAQWRHAASFGSTTIENHMQKSKSVHDRSGPTMKKWRGFVDGTSRCIVDGWLDHVVAAGLRKKLAKNEVVGAADEASMVEARLDAWRDQLRNDKWLSM